MKKSFFIILLTLFTAFVSAQVVNDGSRYAQNSVLKSGKWFKIAVDTSGIYKLTYDDLSSMNIGDPANVRIFGYGGALLPELFTNPYIDDLPEVAIYMNKGADGIFNNGDYILFYAQGVISWTYDYPPGQPPGQSVSMFYHKINHYSNKGYYFLTCDAGIGIGKRISIIDAPTETPNGDIVDFTHYDLHEKDLVNLASGGREFYGEEFNSSAPTQTYVFSTPNMLTQSERIRIKAANRSNSTINIAVAINNVNLDTLKNIAPVTSGYSGVDKKSIFTFTPLSVTNTVTVKLSCSPASAIANLDFIELNVRRRLIMVGNEFYFRNKTTQNQFKRFVVAKAAANTQIWDITDRQNIKQITTTRSSDTLTFVANISSIKEYLAINPFADFKTPNLIVAVANQNLHALPQTDYVIIANKDFLGEAERLAKVHRQRSNLDVTVVDAEKIYNEFSSGTPDATAYRRFVKMFYDRGVSDASGNTKIPKYLLLFGDGSFDNRELLKNASAPIRRLLTYQAVNSVSGTDSYVSDDYFGYMDDNTGLDSGGLSANQQLKIGVGRFPVYSLEQAKTVVDKTIKYMDNNIRGSWKNQLLYIADDGNTGTHANDADSVTRITAALNPELLIKKLYFDAYKQVVTAAGERYPDVERLLDNYIKQGVLMINYMGHGSMNNLSAEQIVTKQSIDKMYNDKFPLWVTATCDFTGFDQFNESGGEKLLWNKNGGTMALFSTTRTVYASSNAELNRYFANHLFDTDENCNPLSLGDIFRLSKNLQKTSSNKFAFILVGDPALKLVYPNPAKVITDSINFNPVNSLIFDTISALGLVNIAGHIENCYGDEIQGFNGIVTAHVFDKEETITTLNNSGNGYDETNTYFQYKDRPNPLFVGSVNVKNGKFKITFVVPKDIKYNFGTGRIVYYVTEGTEGNWGMEGNGYFENFIIGGETENVSIDTIGPDVTLYMNLPTFRNGGKVNPSPLFVADIFDKSGINTIGSGVGHDMIMRISGINKNGKPVANYNNEEIVLNNYYESELNSYQKGKVEYQLNDLEDGNYTIKFRVWDMYNNSTNAELSFVVTRDGKIGADASIYPNPAAVGEPITFYITHDRPSQPLTYSIYVADLAGCKLTTIANKQTITTGTTTEIQWNPATESGILEQGIYIVRIELSTPDEKSLIIPLKLIIKAK